MKILVIEDSLDTAQTMLCLLRDGGYAAETAINGYAALTIAERQRPDVILLDMGLPDFDGITLLRRLRSMPELSRTRIIAVTGRVADDDLGHRAIAEGCEAFLRKPVHFATLEALLAGTPAPAAAAIHDPPPTRH